jgi:hypothetical protein
MRLALVLGAGIAFAALSSLASAQSAPPPSIFDVVEEILERVASPALEHYYGAEKTANAAEDLVSGEEEEGEEFRCKFLRVIGSSHEMCLHH